MPLSVMSRLALRAGVVVLSFLSFPDASAQLPTRPPQALDTRPALIERAAQEERAGNRAAAAAIRARLQDGDFQDGDRVVVEFENHPGAARPELAALMRPDTLLIRAGRMLQFPPPKYENVKDLPVSGLLRSELPDSIRKQLATVYRNPQIRVTSLVSLSVTGAVLAGGFINVPGDIRLNDVIRAAGGIASNANLEKVTIRRGALTLMSGKDAQSALASGITVDGAQLRAGDQIDIPFKQPSNWLAYAGLGLSVVTIFVTVLIRR